MTWASCSLYSLLQRHPSPLSQLCILYIPPYFQKIYKFPPIFAQFRFFCWPYVSLLPTYFDHDAFMFHALHVLDSHALLHCWWEPYTSIFQMHLCSYFASLFNKSCLWVPTIYHICVPRAVCQCGMMLMIMVTAQFCLVHWPVFWILLFRILLFRAISSDSEQLSAWLCVCENQYVFFSSQLGSRKRDLAEYF